jgi:hypothetical protein
MTDRELMQQALDLLDDINQCSLPPTGIPLPAEIDHVMEALRDRLAQPEQKPVACPYCHYSHTLGAVYFDQNCAGCVKRMTAPPQREWQTLTDEEMRKTVDGYFEFDGGDMWGSYRAIEAKLKGKNAL